LIQNLKQGNYIGYTDVSYFQISGLKCGEPPVGLILRLQNSLSSVRRGLKIFVFSVVKCI